MFLKNHLFLNFLCCFSVFHFTDLFWGKDSSFLCPPLAAKVGGTPFFLLGGGGNSGFSKGLQSPWTPHWLQWDTLSPHRTWPLMMLLDGFPNYSFAVVRVLTLCQAFLTLSSEEGKQCCISEGPGAHPGPAWPPCTPGNMSSWSPAEMSTLAPAWPPLTCPPPPPAPGGPECLLTAWWEWTPRIPVWSFWDQR